ncbi:MAG: response regulator transcription factor [Eubacteriales bacterium]|nr:response regulator transcription factor [Eubacteriales bacterium]
MAKILIIEDDQKIARFLELELRHEGYEVTKVHDGRQGLDEALAGDYDLVLLDVLLPGLNGFEVLRRLRKQTDLAVIMLTARDEVMDKVAGLDMGADDYITKPFSIEELLARIRACLRQKSQQEAQSSTLIYGPLVLDKGRHLVTLEAEPVELSAREFDLLAFFMEQPEMVLTRENILENVWEYDFMGESNVVDVYVRYLRHKLDEVYGQKLIHTVRGLGYSLRLE